MHNPVFGAIPRFPNRVAGPLNNPMPYHYILATKGRRTFRCYVRLTHKTADRIHDLLVDEYDLVQVCDVPADQVDRSLLLHRQMHP